MRQLKITVDPDLADSFKSACESLHTSMAATLSSFMADFSLVKPSHLPASLPDYSNKKHRRAAIKTISKQLILIREAEMVYRSNIPANLSGSVHAENAEQFVDLIDEVIDLLSQL